MVEWWRMDVLTLIQAISHLAANCSCACWRSHSDKANRTTSPAKSRGKIQRQPKSDLTPQISTQHCRGMSTNTGLQHPYPSGTQDEPHPSWQPCCQRVVWLPQWPRPWRCMSCPLHPQTLDPIRKMCVSVSCHFSSTVSHSGPHHSHGNCHKD